MSVSAVDITAYQWQVNSGSGFYDINNGGIYSGATTDTLTIGVTDTGMNRYLYRVQVTNSLAETYFSDERLITVGSSPVITSQPSASTIVAGANTTFSVTANNAIDYKWQVDAGSGFTDITNGAPYSGATTATLTITGATAGMSGYLYRVVATGAALPNATSNAATLTVNSPPTITSEPSPSTIGVGGNTTFSVTASNATSYWWQVDTGSGFYSISNNATYSGTDTATLTITGATIGMNGYLYRVIARGAASPSALSIPAALTVRNPPTITSQPTSSTISAGANTTFSVTASNATVYQWQVDTGAGFASISNGAPYSGATTATLTITGATAGMNGYRYRVVATGPASPSATSSAANLTVNSPPAITSQPSASSIGVGANTTFSVTASNATSYQWQVDTGAGFASISNGAPYSGATTATLTIIGATAGMNGYLYRVLATGTTSPAATSNAAVLTVNSPPTITSQPTASTIAVGADTTFSVTASNATAYQWQVYNGSGFSSISNNATYSGATTATLTITGATAGMNGYRYRVVVTGLALPSVTSTAAALTINSPPAITSQPNAATIVAGANATFSVTASSATEYQWQLDTGSGFSAVANGAPYSGATTATLTITGATAAMNGYLYRVVATGNSSPAAVSNAAVLTVNTPAAIISQPTSSTINASENTSFTVVAANTTSYRWQVDTGSGFINLTDGGVYSGSQTATLSVTGATRSMNGYRYQVVVDSTLQLPTTSTAATLTVNPPANLVISPAPGELPEAMAGEAYAQQLSTTGTSLPLIYSLASGTLPNGMVLNVSTGKLTGPLSETAAVTTYSFTIKATASDGATGTAAYTMRVKARAVTVPNQSVTVPTGSTPTNVNITQGATGGPFTSANIVSVQPSSAGTATLSNGEFAQAGPIGTVGWYLKFTPNPAYSGAAVVSFQLTSALGVSNIGTVTYNLNFDPAQVASDTAGLVSGFVQSRQSMVASSANVPGLIERRQLPNSTHAVSASISPSSDAITANFASSLIQMQAAKDKEYGIVHAEMSAFDIWVNGTFMLHNRAQNDGRWGSFGMVSVGTEYLLSEKALLGFAIHVDSMRDPSRNSATLSGTGWQAGPYASFELGDGVFWDTSLFHGGSSNTIDTTHWDGSFNTTRWTFDTAVKGQWQLDEVTTLTPTLRTVYLSETVHGYYVDNSSGSVLSIDGFTSEQLRASFGIEIARQFIMETGATLTPRLGLTGGFSGLNGSGDFGAFSTGLTFQSPNAWNLDLGLTVNIEGNGQTAAGARASVKAGF